MGVRESNFTWPNCSKKQNKWTNVKQKQGHGYGEQRVVVRGEEDGEVSIVCDRDLED